MRRYYPENHFSHVVIDECHRSAWGTWSEVLTRNASAFQIGLTATPRELTVNNKADADITADNVRHFGEPVHEYSLAQGIEDGYLTPCDIRQGRVSIDAETLARVEVMGHDARRSDTGVKAKPDEDKPPTEMPSSSASQCSPAELNTT